MLAILCLTSRFPPVTYCSVQVLSLNSDIIHVWDEHNGENTHDVETAGRSFKEK